MEFLQRRELNEWNNNGIGWNGGGEKRVCYLIKIHYKKGKEEDNKSRTALIEDNWLPWLSLLLYGNSLTLTTYTIHAWENGGREKKGQDY